MQLWTDRLTERKLPWEPWEYNRPDNKHPAQAKWPCQTLISQTDLVEPSPGLSWAFCPCLSEGLRTISPSHAIGFCCCLMVFWCRRARVCIVQENWPIQRVLRDSPPHHSWKAQKDAGGAHFFSLHVMGFLRVNILCFLIFLKRSHFYFSFMSVATKKLKTLLCMGPSGYLFLHSLRLAFIKEAGPWKMLLSPVGKVTMAVMCVCVCVATLINTYVQQVLGVLRFPNIHQMHRPAPDVINSRNETMDSKAWVTASITSVPELFLPRWLEIYLSPVFASWFIFSFFFFFCRQTAASARVTCLKWWFIYIFFNTITPNLQPTRDFFASEVKYFMYVHNVLDIQAASSEESPSLGDPSCTMHVRRAWACMQSRVER